MNDLPLVKMQEIASKKFDLANFPVDFIANFIYHSLSFESQNLTLEAVKNVLEDQPSTLEEKRVIAIKNYRKAIDFVFEKVKNKEDLDENALKDLHEILMDEVNVGGLYRNVDISIQGSNHTPPGHLKVYDRMKKYFVTLADYPTNTFDEIIEKAAFSLLQLDKIHPFLDGNGKLARMVLNYHLLMNGLAPVVFPYTEKQYYFECIEEFKVNKSIACFKEYLIKLEKEALGV